MVKKTKQEPKARPDRRQKIVKAAIQCFIKSGVAQTKISEVAAKAGVDQPLISYYFSTLENLHEAVIIDVLSVLREASIRPIEEHSNDMIRALTQYIRAPFEFAQNQAGLFSIWMYFYYLASYSTKFVELNSQIREAGRNRISVIIYTGIESGVFSVHKSMSVSDVAIAIQGIITGNTIMVGTEKNESFEKYIRITTEASLALLGVYKKIS